MECKFRNTGRSDCARVGCLRSLFATLSPLRPNIRRLAFGQDGTRTNPRTQTGVSATLEDNSRRLRGFKCFELAEEPGAVFLVHRDDLQADAVLLFAPADYGAAAHLT